MIGVSKEMPKQLLLYIPKTMSQWGFVLLLRCSARIADAVTAYD